MMSLVSRACRVPQLTLVFVCTVTRKRMNTYAMLTFTSRLTVTAVRNESE